MPRRKSHPYITVTGTVDGVTTTRIVPVRRNENTGLPLMLPEQPSEGIPQPVLLGNTEKRSNLDVSQIIFDSWSGGMGEEKYRETEGLSSFWQSECDTSYREVLVLPRLATALTGSVPFTLSAHARMVHLGYSLAEVLVYNPGGQAARYRPDTEVWVEITGAAGEPDSAFWVERGLTATFLVAQTDSDDDVVWRSTDGVTWDNVTGTGLPASPVLNGLAVHDNKVCVLHADTANSRFTLYTSTDAHTAASPTWTAQQSFHYVLDFEAAQQLFVWQYPVDPREPCLWALTNRRLWYWDEFQATPRWVLWKTFGVYSIPAVVSSLPVTIRGVYAHPWGRKGNLYATNTTNIDYLYEYIANGVEQIVGPNVRGGLPTAAQVQPFQLDSDGHHLFAFGGVPNGAPSNTGAAYKMNDENGWHYVYRHATATVCGGCVGPDAIYVVLDNETVMKIAHRDESAIPQYAVGREYVSGAKVHYTALTDGGTELLDKELCWFHLHARIPTGAQIRVGYMRDTDSSPTYLGTLTDTATDYHVVDAPTGASRVQWKQIRVVLELTRGTATSATPIVWAVGLNYQRLPKVRYSPQAIAALTEGQAPWDTPGKKFGRYGLPSLRNWLRALAGTTVAVSFGGLGRSTAPTYRSLDRALFAAMMQTDPEGGTGDIQASFFDLSAPDA